MSKTPSSMYAKYVETFVQLRKDMNSNIGMIEANDVYLTDEELQFMDIWMNIKDPMKPSELHNLRFFVGHICKNVIGNYKQLFDDTSSKELYSKLEYVQQLDESTKKALSVLEKVSYYAISIIAQILMFLLRVTRRAIYSFRVVELEAKGDLERKLLRQDYDVREHKDGIAKKLSKVIRYVINIINAAIKVDDEISKFKIQQLSDTEANEELVTVASKELDVAFQNIGVLESLCKNIVDFAFNSKEDAASAIIKRALNTNEVIDATSSTNEVLVKDMSHLVTLLGKKYQQSIQDYWRASYDGIRLFEGDAKVNNALFHITQNAFYVQNQLKRDVETIKKELRENPEKSLKVLHEMNYKLSPDAPLYNQLLQLYELLSGSVRVIVRLRDNNTNNHFSDGDLKQYKINLVESTKEVHFKNATSLTRFYPKEKLQNFVFGPFYSLITAQSDGSIVDKALGFDRLQNLLLPNDGSSGKNVVLYSYGYSGSGKTFTFIGKPNDPNNTHGIIWKIMDRLNKSGATIKLVKRIKLYGVLDNVAKDSKALQFQDTITWYNGQDKSQTNSPYWNSNTKTVNNLNGTEESSSKEVIKELIQSDVNTIDKGIPEKFSFIKATSNNTESSRGFYIMKFEVRKGDSVSYLGVVDMAGNEDPYDISSMMWPTLPFNNMKEVVENSGKAAYYDMIYNTIASTLEFIVISIASFLNSISLVGYHSGEFSLLNLSKDKTRLVLHRDAHKIMKVDQKELEHRLSIFIQRFPNTLTWLHKIFKYTEPEISAFILNSEKSVDKLSGKNLDKEVNEVNVQLNVTSSKPKKVNSYHIELSVTYGLLKFILDEELKKRKGGQPLNESEFNEDVPTLSMIKKLTILSSFDSGYTKPLERLRLKYVLNKLNTQFEKNPEAIFFPVKVSNTFQDVTQSNFWVPLKTSVIASIKNSLCNSDYFLPISEENSLKDKVYPFDTIAQIIKEGYYINKANAELINYFEHKRNFNISPPDYFNRKSNVKKGGKRRQVGGTDQCIGTSCDRCLIPRIDNPETHMSPQTYKFCNNFDIQHYNKFNHKFTNANPTTDAQQDFYDTNLVPIIVNEFSKREGKYDILGTKDLMFCCIQNDKQLAKALGAIDTLRLVQQLKST